MSFKVLLAPQRQNTTPALDQFIHKRLTQYPDDQFLVIVPNHIKFSREVQLLQHLRGNQTYIASSHVQVLSFSRLTWFFLRDQPSYQLQRLSTTGKLLVISRLLQRHQQDCPLLSSQLRQVGFLQELLTQFDELVAAHLTPEDWQQTLQLAINKSGLADRQKLTELGLLYQHYLNELPAHHIGETDLIEQLIHLLGTRPLGHFHLIIQGFSHLSSLQLDLLATFERQQAEVVVSLVGEPYLLKNRTSRYYKSTVQILQQLEQAAPLTSLKEELEPLTLRVTSDLATVEKAWINHTNSPESPQSHQALSNHESLQIWSCANPTDEIRQVTNQIRSYVTKRGYHYRDFLVLAEHLNDYSPLLTKSFQETHIPFYSDESHQLIQHPLIQLILDLGDLTEQHLHPDKVLDCWKSGLLDISRLTNHDFSKEKVTMLAEYENYIYAFGIRYQTFLKPQRWLIKGGPYLSAEDQSLWLTQIEKSSTLSKQQARLDSMQQATRGWLKRWLKIRHTSQTVGDFCRQLYDWLQEQGVVDNLVEQEQLLTNQGELSLAQGNRQAYQALLQVLDECVSIWDDEPFDLDLLMSIFKTTFSNTEYAQIPTVLDAVQVSERHMVQDQQHKIVFFLGFSEQNVPQFPSTNQFISEDDRERINEVIPDRHQLNLTSEQAIDEFPQEYGSTFLLPTEQLILSYSQTYPESKQNQVQHLASYGQWLQQTFKIKLQQPAVSLRSALTSTYNPNLLVAYLNQVQRSYFDHHQSLPPALLDFKQLLAEQVSTATRAFEAGYYRNVPQPLTPKTAEALYGKSLKGSVSQFESYFRNPYEYFLKFGLRLKPRREFILDAQTTGSFFHAYLDAAFNLIKERSWTWSQLNEQQKEHLHREVMAQLLAQPDFQILGSTGQMVYLKQLLAQTIQATFAIIEEQEKRVSARPLRTEINFGLGHHALPALHLKVDEQHEVELRGKIDRLDVATMEEQVGYIVLDYKSSPHTINPAELYYGLSLQMLTYLAVVAQNRTQLGLGKAQPLGAYYMTIQNKPLRIQDIQKKGYLPLKLKKGQLTGLTLDWGNQEFSNLYLSDHDKTDVYPFKFKKNGDLAKESTKWIITPQDLEKLIYHEQQLMIKAAQTIFSGAIPLTPVRNKADSALTYSDYLAIMNFDPLLPENRYFDIPQFSLSDLLNQLAKEE